MILCCGEALIDMIPAATAAGEPAIRPVSGGAVFNTAIALGRIGTPVGFFSGLSSDLFGDQLRASLEESGVDHALAVTRDLPTTLAFVSLTGGQARYTFYDENTAGRMLAPSDLPDVPANVTALFFGGISLISEPCGTAYETLARAQSGRKVIMLDPNIRLSFIKNEAAYRERLRQMIGASDIMKVSDEDLEWIIPGEEPLETKVQKLLGAGPKLVFVTAGDAGATAFAANGVKVSAAGRQVEVADTVGAGDTFNAAVLAAMSASGRLSLAALAEVSAAELEEVMTFANAAAAITVSRVGANPPTAHEIRALLATTGTESSA